MESFEYDILHFPDNEQEALAVIGSLAALARRERVPIKPTKSAVEYWVLRRGEKITGFAGATLLSPTAARLKSSFVHPNYRGNGCYSLLWETRMKNLLSRGITEFSAFTTPLSLPVFLKNGFRITRTDPKTNISYVVKSL